MVMTDKEYVVNGAHNSPITSIEFTKMGNDEIIFTGSEDKTVKAWKLDRQQGQLQGMGQTNADYAVTSLKMMSEIFCVIGLQNGYFKGWNL